MYNKLSFSCCYSTL